MVRIVGRPLRHYVTRGTPFAVDSVSNRDVHSNEDVHSTAGDCDAHSNDTVDLTPDSAAPTQETASQFQSKHAVSTAGAGYFAGLTCGGAFPAAL
jgi:hypothetical protein